MPITPFSIAIITLTFPIGATVDGKWWAAKIVADKVGGIKDRSMLVTKPKKLLYSSPLPFSHSSILTIHIFQDKTEYDPKIYLIEGEEFSYMKAFPQPMLELFLKTYFPQGPRKSID
ncbi:hypothetical protein CR513_13219, partial [Mucuna pruriens]